MSEKPSVDAALLDGSFIRKAGEAGQQLVADLKTNGVHVIAISAGEDPGWGNSFVSRKMGPKGFISIIEEL